MCPAESTESRSFSALDRSKSARECGPELHPNVSHRRRVTTAQTCVANLLVQPRRQRDATTRNTLACLVAFSANVTLVA